MLRFHTHAKSHSVRSWHGCVAHGYCGGGRHSATNNAVDFDSFVLLDSDVRRGDPLGHRILERLRLLVVIEPVPREEVHDRLHRGHCDNVSGVPRSTRMCCEGGLHVSRLQAMMGKVGNLNCPRYEGGATRWMHFS